MNQFTCQFKSLFKAVSIASLCFLFINASAYAEPTQFKQGDIQFTPISHATFVMQTSVGTIYIDPVGDKALFSQFAQPDLILITDIHGDHLNADLVKQLAKSTTQVIAPQAVADKLQGVNVKVLNNQESTQFKSINIEAIAMYNLTPERLKYHKKGRGNGYLITADNKRTYISGDTEDVPEMRMLKEIDYAFICMNLPYTMTVEQAASAVLEMRPNMVFPYHYRGPEGLSDVAHFATLVSKKSNIKVKQLKWY